MAEVPENIEVEPQEPIIKVQKRLKSPLIRRNNSNSDQKYSQQTSIAE